ncbi:hypothetical protein ABW20_dc0100798 [Dactylellina cionopaga]|nr:hypothetical protein ABW20_dc0100798 [Dactylellina cionopaga]
MVKKNKSRSKPPGAPVTEGAMEPVLPPIEAADPVSPLGSPAEQPSSLKPSSRTDGRSTPMDIKDAMNMSPPEPPVTIPRKFPDTSKNTEPKTDITETTAPPSANTAESSSQFAPQPASASASQEQQPQTGLTNIHSDAEDVRPPERAAASALRRNSQISAEDNGQSDPSPKVQSGSGKRTSSGNDGKEGSSGGFRGFWNRIVAAFK